MRVIPMRNPWRGLPCAKGECNPLDEDGEAACTANRNPLCVRRHDKVVVRVTPAAQLASEPFRLQHFAHGVNVHAAAIEVVVWQVRSSDNDCTSRIELRVVNIFEELQPRHVVCVRKSALVEDDARVQHFAQRVRFLLDDITNTQVDEQIGSVGS